MPGDRRYRQREQSLKEGIVLSADDLERLEALARV
jgi:delta1-piperideine-2-carboxylate reductase